MQASSKPLERSPALRTPHSCCRLPRMATGGCELRSRACRLGEDPHAIHPSQYLSLAASPEGTRRAYMRTGARFAVDVDGTLTLQLDPLQTDRTHEATSCGSSTKTA